MKRTYKECFVTIHNCIGTIQEKMVGGNINMLRYFCKNLQFSCSSGVFIRGVLDSRQILAIKLLCTIQIPDSSVIQIPQKNKKSQTNSNNH